MKRYRTLAVAGLLALAGAACADLDVTNLNEPDRSRAISTPTDVESLIAGSFQSWWLANHDAGGGVVLSTMADEHTASWGNFGMQDMSSEPRVAINNDPSYNYAYVIEDPWIYSYRALAGLRDGLAAIDGGIEIGTGGQDTPRARAFGKFVQGLTLGTLGLLYDQAFILDENTDIETTGLSPYTEVMEASFTKLEEAIQIAEGNTFEIPSAWLGGFEGADNQMLARLAHSYLARYMASWGRSPSERESSDWSAIASHAEAGVTQDFGPISNGFTTNWYDYLKSYGGVMPIWARTDYRTLGPADVSGEWEEWVATPAEQRQEFLITTPDRRVTGSLDDPTSNGLFFRYHGPSNFRPERGTYHFSMYGDNRWWDYLNDPFMTGMAVDMTERELDFLRAEAALRAGNTGEALSIVNEYRVGNGQLPAATASGAPGGPDTCVPQNPDGTCGDLWETFQYDKRIEVWHTGMGIAFWDDRGWGDLVPGTAVHFPVPGEELLVLLQDIYTFGGAEGGAAPAPGKLATTPEGIRARLAAYERFDANFNWRTGDRFGPARH